MKRKDTEIIETKLKAKTRAILEIGILEDFDNYHIIVKVESIMVV